MVNTTKYSFTVVRDIYYILYVDDSEILNSLIIDTAGRLQTLKKHYYVLSQSYQNFLDSTDSDQYNVMSGTAIISQIIVVHKESNSCPVLPSLVRLYLYTKSQTHVRYCHHQLDYTCTQRVKLMSGTAIISQIILVHKESNSCPVLPSLVRLQLYTKSQTHVQYCHHQLDYSCTQTVKLMSSTAIISQIIVVYKESNSCPVLPSLVRLQLYTKSQTHVRYCHHQLDYTCTQRVKLMSSTAIISQIIVVHKESNSCPVLPSLVRLQLYTKSQTHVRYCHHQLDYTCTQRVKLMSGTAIISQIIVVHKESNSCPVLPSLVRLQLYTKSQTHVRYCHHQLDYTCTQRVKLMSGTAIISQIILVHKESNSCPVLPSLVRLYLYTKSQTHVQYCHHQLDYSCTQRVKLMSGTAIISQIILVHKESNSCPVLPSLVRLYLYTKSQTHVQYCHHQLDYTCTQRVKLMSGTAIISQIILVHKESNSCPVLPSLVRLQLYTKSQTHVQYCHHQLDYSCTQRVKLMSW